MAKAYFPKALDRIVCSPLCRAAGLVSFAGACVLVGLVPWRWPGAYGFEFTISRIGFVLMSLPLVGRSFRTSMSRSKTIIHKLAGLAYPTLLVSSAVLPLSALAVGGLNYVSSSSVLSLLVGELPLCLALGVLVQLLIDFRLAMPA
jgi:peptidoglycan/LPS O-acetylase OafA/YrhL